MMGAGEAEERSQGTPWGGRTLKGFEKAREGSCRFGEPLRQPHWGRQAAVREVTVQMRGACGPGQRTGASEEGWPGLCISGVPGGLTRNRDGQMWTVCLTSAPGIGLSSCEMGPRAVATRECTGQPVLWQGSLWGVPGDGPSIQESCFTAERCPQCWMLSNQPQQRARWAWWKFRGPSTPRAWEMAQEVPAGPANSEKWHPGASGSQTFASWVSWIQGCGHTRAQSSGPPCPPVFGIVQQK